MAALPSSLSSTLAAAVLLMLLGCAVLRYADATVLGGKHGKPQQPYKQPYQKRPYGYQKEFPDYPLTSPDNCTAIPVENVKVGGAVVLSPQRTALGLSYPEWHTAWWRAMYRQDAINHPLDPEADPLNSGCVAAIRSDFEGTFYYDLFGKDLGGTYKKDNDYRDKKDDDYRDYKKSPPPAYFISGVLGSPVTPSFINRRCTNIIAETPIIFPMLNQAYFFAPGVDEQFFPRGRPSSESAASQVAGAVSECADDVFALINGERVPLTSEFGSVSTFVRDMDISGGTFEVVDRLFNVSLYSAAFPKGIKDIDAMDAGYYIILPKGLPYKGKTFKHTLEFGLARNCTTTFEFFDRAVNEPPSAGNCTTTTFAYTATTYRYSITVQKPY